MEGVLYAVGLIAWLALCLYCILTWTRANRNKKGGR